MNCFVVLLYSVPVAKEQDLKRTTYTVPERMINALIKESNRLAKLACQPSSRCACLSHCSKAIEGN